MFINSKIMGNRDLHTSHLIQCERRFILFSNKDCIWNLNVGFSKESKFFSLRIFLEVVVYMYFSSLEPLHEIFPEIGFVQLQFKIQFLFNQFLVIHYNTKRITLVINIYDRRPSCLVINNNFPVMFI